MAVTILLVDDDTDARELFAEALQEDGYRVLQAGRVVEGLRLFVEHAPDLVLVDGLLPDRTGLDLISEVRRRGSSVRIIFMSAFWKDAQSFKHLKSELGVWSVLRKPLGLQTMRSAVHEAVDSLGARVREGGR